MTASVGSRRWIAWIRSTLTTSVVAILLYFGAANIMVRSTWQEVEDGVLWVASDDGVAAAEVGRRSPAAAAGVQPGDVLLALDAEPIDAPADVARVLHRSVAGAPARYTLLRLGAPAVVEIVLQPVPQGQRTLYYVLASVGMFALLVGASVRLRRPGDQATLHFFWLCLAFFGTFTFSFSGRLDRLDWFFYWADTVARLLLPALFLHFVLAFPERGRGWTRQRLGGAVFALYVLPLVLGGASVAAFVWRPVGAEALVRAVGAIDRIEQLYLATYFVAGVAVLVRALRHARSLTARRQLRWILWGAGLGAVPFAVGNALPYALGVDPSLGRDLLAIPLGLIPLAFASAIVRYRLMDVEVIIKRALVYTAAIAAIVAIYAVLLRVASQVFLDGTERYNTIIAMLATLVVVLLARPVKNAIQNALDRAFYRDRYDYRRALVGFARDLNSDLDLQRLSERLVTRVRETLVVGHMALLLTPPGEEPAGEFGVIHSAGFEPDARLPVLRAASGLGGRLASGSTVALDDPEIAQRFAAAQIGAWRDCGVHYFVPCIAKGATIAVMALGRRQSGEPLSSEDLALLEAVAGQIATAIENGRLYQQLHDKASELDRMRAFNENILESLSDGLVVVDLDDRIVRWNLALASLYGVRREDAIGRRLDDVFDAAFLDVLRGAGRESPAGATLYRILLTPRAGGGEKRLLVNAAAVPLRTPDGARSGTIVIIEDITGRVHLEEQLQISEKMASIGLLAAGVAHEVNTPLTGISSFTQMLLQGADPNDSRTRLLEKIERQTFRAAKIVNGLLNLSRPTRSESGPVDLNAIVNDVLSLLEHQFKLGRIKVRKALASPSPVVVGVEHKLQQVFLNLFLNARDAMPRGGWLSISTRLDGERGVAEMADTGSGIPTEHLSRIYDPFFTTKEMGRGTGLGLSITYGIVQEHDGTIQCESAPGQGTHFTVSLPLAGIAAQRSERMAH